MKSKSAEALEYRIPLQTHTGAFNFVYIVSNLKLDQQSTSDRMNCKNIDQSKPF